MSKYILCFYVVILTELPPLLGASSTSFIRNDTVLCHMLWEVLICHTHRCLFVFFLSDSTQLVAPSPDRSAINQLLKSSLCDVADIDDLGKYSYVTH